MKELQIAVEYVMQTYGVHIFDDIDSFLLYLNTHDFLSAEITAEQIEDALNKPVSGELSKDQKNIIDRYAAFMFDMSADEYSSDLPTEIDSLHGELQSFTKQKHNANNASRVIKKPSTTSSDLSVDSQVIPTFSKRLSCKLSLPSVLPQQSSNTTAQHKNQTQLLNTQERFMAPNYIVAEELEGLNLRRAKLIEKEKELLQLQQLLNAKEEVLEKRSVPQVVSKQVAHIDSQIVHLKSLTAQLSQFEHSQEKVLKEHEQILQQHILDISQLSHQKKSLESEVLSLTKKLDQMGTQLTKTQSVLYKKEADLKKMESEYAAIVEQLQSRKNIISMREKELSELENEVRDMHAQASSLKEEYILKNRELRLKEVQVGKSLDAYEHGLKTKYQSRIKELESHYQTKITELNHLIEEHKVNSEHLRRKEDEMRRKELSIQSLKGETELLKNQYEESHKRLMRNSQLRETEESLSFTQTSSDISRLDAQERESRMPGKERYTVPVETSTSDKTLSILYNIAKKEIPVNPQLAYKTYVKLYELYHSLPVSQREMWYKRMIHLHREIIDKQQQNDASE